MADLADIDTWHAQALAHGYGRLAIGTAAAAWELSIKPDGRSIGDLLAAHSYDSVTDSVVYIYDKGRLTNIRIVRSLTNREST